MPSPLLPNGAHVPQDLEREGNLDTGAARGILLPNTSRKDGIEDNDKAVVPGTEAELAAVDKGKEAAMWGRRLEVDTQPVHR
jgi:hypothetical protein